METQNTADLKKILETIEADKKMAQKMQAMQVHIQEFLISQNHGEDSASSESVNKRGMGGWYPNDIKVDIPKYDGKLDPDEFVEWLPIVNGEGENLDLAKDEAKFLPTYYVQTSFSQLHSLRQGTGTAKEYSCEFEYLLMECDVPKDDPQTLVRYLGGLEPQVANVFEFHFYQTLTEQLCYLTKWTLNNDPKESLRHIASECPKANFELTGSFEFESDLVVSPESPHDNEVEVCLVVRRTLCTTPVLETELQREQSYKSSLIRVKCDVILMDACNVLLGRPWQFDRIYCLGLNSRKTTGISPFMAVYGANPTTLLDLVVIDTSAEFSKEARRKHVLFKPGDLVWLHFQKERFPSKRHSKLSPRSDGPFKVIAKVNDNAYAIDLLGNSCASPTINVADLQPYYDPDEPLQSLRLSFFEDGEDDRKSPVQAHNSSSTNPTQRWISLVQLETAIGYELIDA
ncbi:transposon ty3-I gag-pol polyprotein [Tanacetum coccineum]